MNKILFFILLVNVKGFPLKKKECKLDSINSDLPKPKFKTQPQLKNTYENLLIDVIFTVIHDNDNGKISKSILKKQISVLNDAFSGKYSKKSMINTNIKFRLNKVNYINNNIFYKKCDIYDSKISKLYGVDNDLNINIIICESEYYLGWAYMPWYFNEKNKMNSVYINTISLPSKKYSGYNLGMTGVHELGHFFGLPHTFSSTGRCIDGDMINDTPVEKYPSFTCSERDSCPELKGKDPITNFMDYSPDECLFEFSFLQINRMWDMIDKYKPKLKMKSQNNYLRTKNSISYYKKGNGLCVDKNGNKFDTIKINNEDKFLSHKDCKQYLNTYNSYAYTFVSEKIALEQKFKYNCFIHLTNLIDNIKPEPSIDKFSKANCYLIKLVPKA